jgi:hypothetical protein
VIDSLDHGRYDAVTLSVQTDGVLLVVAGKRRKGVHGKRFADHVKFTYWAWC